MQSNKRPEAKPEKPYPDFPLFPHANGQWAKKINGKPFYFGIWAEPDKAVARYDRERDALYAGRKPQTTGEGVTVKQLTNHFLNAKNRLVTAEEIKKRTFDEYTSTCELIADQFGRERIASDLTPQDFALLRSVMAGRWGPVHLANEIQRVKSVFKYGYEARLLKTPMLYGPDFARPSKKVMRLARAKKKLRMFTKEDASRVVAAAKPPIKAMVLLGLNCALGNTDCASMLLSDVNLKTGWLDYPRRKTGVERRCPLWPETVAAIRESISVRPKPKNPEHNRLLFLTQRGLSFESKKAEYTHHRVAGEFAKLIDAEKLNCKGIGFYGLRHTFQTVADECRDAAAVQHIMGHSPNDRDMSAVYREKISDARLLAVTNYVRSWLLEGK
jgi:integrase